MENSINIFTIEIFYQVEERAVAVEELFDSEEVFCTGTAMVVNPVNSITYQGKRYTN